MRSTHFPRISHTGTLNVNGTEWIIQTYHPHYPTRNYVIFSVCPKDKPTQGMSFTSEAAFEEWLGQTIEQPQRNLF